MVRDSRALAAILFVMFVIVVVFVVWLFNSYLLPI